MSISIPNWDSSKSCTVKKHAILCLEVLRLIGLQFAGRLERVTAMAGTGSM